jgi:hypothetical protein
MGKVLWCALIHSPPSHEVAQITLGGVFPVWLLAFCVGVLAAAAVWATSDDFEPPSYHAVGRCPAL